LNLDILLSHLTFDDRIFIISKETLEIWFNNYTSQYIKLEDLYIPIEINQLSIEKKLNSIWKNDFLLFISILAIVCPLSYLSYKLYDPGLDWILKEVFSKIDEGLLFDRAVEWSTTPDPLDNSSPKLELALDRAIAAAESTRFVGGDSYMNYLMKDDVVQENIKFKYLKYYIKFIYWIYNNYRD
jgi:hypothetical protein